MTACAKQWGILENQKNEVCSHTWSRGRSPELEHHRDQFKQSCFFSPVGIYLIIVLECLEHSACVL